LKLACQEHLLPGDDILKRWEFAASAGFDGIELRGTDDWRERLEDLKAAQERGVVFSSVCLVSDRFIGDLDADRRREAVEHMKSLLSGIAELGGVGAITPAAFGLTSKALPPFEAPRTEDEDRRVLLEALEELGEHAYREGTLVLLEPLNRYEDHMLNRLDQAVELCKAVGRPSVKVMGDLFHMNIEEDDPPSPSPGGGLPGPRPPRRQQPRPSRSWSHRLRPDLRRVGRRWVRRLPGHGVQHQG
jgi:sugar phosphate isomerase/epimerase